MNRSIIVIFLILLPVLSACGAAADSNSAQPVEDGPTEAAFATPSSTPPPTDTSAPMPTSTQVVEPTDIPTEPSPGPDTPVPEPTVVPTDPPAAEPTAPPTSEPDWLNTVGRTADNLVYLGNPEAPVTIIDYS